MGSWYAPLPHPNWVDVWQNLENLLWYGFKRFHYALKVKLGELESGCRAKQKSGFYRNAENRLDR